MAQPTQEMVDEALRIATEENGYSFKGMTAQTIACDLSDYHSWPDDVDVTSSWPDDVDITNLDLEYVTKLVEDWIKRHPEQI